ncbi:MAG TPA: hypothetical protein VGJ57_00300 [Nitrospirales bacterium]
MIAECIHQDRGTLVVAMEEGSWRFLRRFMAIGLLVYAQEFCLSGR